MIPYIIENKTKYYEQLIFSKFRKSKIRSKCLFLSFLVDMLPSCVGAKYRSRYAAVPKTVENNVHCLGDIELKNTKIILYIRRKFVR